MENINKILLIKFFLTSKKKIKLTSILLLSMFLMSSVVLAQGKHVVKGSVLDETNQPLIGATVIVKNVKNTGVVTDVDGKFTINVPDGQNTLVVSYIGFNPQDVNIAGKSTVTVKLKDNTVNMEEVVVVGYGQQKKASIVGSITQTSGKVLERAGGVSSLGAALTGNLPGVVTMTTTGKPGSEDPTIYIRGVSSWNNSNPLILVDGIEREMSSVDINSVESISVLKDASATAVYGVRGANGVILITTKRGNEGKAKIDVGFSSTVKTPSKLPGKMDAYDAYELKNKTLEYEMNSQPSSAWPLVRSQSFIDNYRNQTTQAQKERYPNIDWTKLTFKDYTTSYNANVNVSGGTKFVKYFSAVDYQHEGDLMRVYPTEKGYNTGYTYDRINSRANLDFELTKSTKFMVNLSGSYGRTKSPFTVITENNYYAGAYGLGSDIFYPRYSDGSWGYSVDSGVLQPNPLSSLALSGVQYTTTTRIATDFALNQDLGMLLKGLTAKVTVSLDNKFIESQRGQNDAYADYQQKSIDPVTGNVTVKNTNDATTNFDFYPSNTWTSQGGSMQNWSTYRNLNYQAQLLYGARFGDHNVTAMGNVARQEQATGDGLPSYREDWVFRTTYNYKDKYFVEYNGAYNGSEKFATKYRFGFFSSGAVGWLISEEKFMKSLTFLDQLKLRASYGQIGDDSGDRFLYMDLYNNSTTQVPMTTALGENSSYKFYTQSQIGNANIQWEKVTKKNVGVDFSFFKNLIAGSVDVFNDYRTDIIIKGKDRSVPSYFGATAPSANLGSTKVHGYEIDLRFNKTIGKLHLWANVSMTHSVDKVINRDDPDLTPAYLKKAGYAMNQTKSLLTHGMYNTWDELYGTTAFDSSDGKIPGNFRIVDFNADGVINGTKDQAAYGYPTNPQNTYNETIGADWKGFSVMVQFYGVNNVTRYIENSSFSQTYINTAYLQNYWSKDNTSADTPLPKVTTGNSLSGNSNGNRYQYDGSYIRLKNAEVAYTFTSKAIKSIGLQSLRVYLNGDNLLLWTKAPDDREVNGSSAYPTVKRFNLGVKVTL